MEFGQWRVFYDTKTFQKGYFALFLATHIPSGTKIIRSFYWKFNGKIKENSSLLNLMTSKNGKEFPLLLWKRMNCV